jgi:hypothetical protein
LEGALRTLHRYKPKLQISVYHRPLHFLEIPLLLLRENLGYVLYLGHHSPALTESVLYAGFSSGQVKPASHIVGCRRASSEQRLKTAEKQARLQAESLAGQEVLFFGAGRAYQRYKRFFSACLPYAVLVDKAFLPPGRRLAVDGLPLLTPERLPQEKRQLPLVLFAAKENLPTALASLHTSFPERDIESIVRCVLFDE